MTKKVAVLGAYGFIGAACVRAFRKEGHEVLGIGRSKEAALSGDSEIDWCFRDIAKTSAPDWKVILEGVDVVVNASGALQDGARDKLTAIHETAVSELLDALDGFGTTFIQISAAGVSLDAPTDFFRTKARGDVLIEQSDLNWIILRPTLVIGAQAYGGTALLRASAATPLVGFSIYPNAPVQTVFVDDLANAVVAAAGGDMGTRFIADLTEADARPFHEVVTGIRSWLGYRPWKLVFPLPVFLLKAVSRMADGLGWLGWRSPLRTNALVSLENGIIGDPSNWIERGGAPFRSLEDTLRVLPATAQERTFARAYLLLPVAIAALSLFWILSGLIGLINLSAASSVLTDAGFSQGAARASVLAGSAADLTLGLAALKRSWARPACLGMIAVAAVYLGAATLLVPGLWLDPLGPLVKVIPSIMLALMVALMLERR
jgi:uncharacterized protein YbjT (DUF2867 family)